MTKECQADLPQSFTLPNIPLKTNVQTCTMTRNDHIHVVSSCASSLVNSLNYPLAINFDLACELDRESRCKLSPSLRLIRAKSTTTFTPKNAALNIAYQNLHCY